MEDNKNGLSCLAALGISLAVVLSWTSWHNIWWAILHGVLNWIYVIYYAIKYL